MNTRDKQQNKNKLLNNKNTKLSVI